MSSPSGSNMEGQHGQDNAAKPKRRLSDDFQDGASGSDQWKNKRPNNVNNNYGGYNQQNFNRNRPTDGATNMGNNMGPLNPNGMADGMPPGLFGKCNQNLAVPALSGF